ncbi:hypothetical protein [Virgisporangium aliadipatigenens]|uniref:hypothetical protein n=1 Tax=Virgisporangium aliadipatigenens TaxID=741659 RepID=UPI00194143A3|nr:hypothetical protein [Virgisporangium aliadipatigenens]
MASVILGAAAGLLLMFGLVSLLCSAVVEVVSNLLQMRARYLLRGLRTMLDSTVTGKSTPVYGDVPGDGHGLPNPAVAQEKDLRGLHTAALDPDTAAHAAKVVNDLAVAANPPAGPSTAAVDTQGKVDAAQEALWTTPGGLTIALFGHPLIQSMQTKRISIGRFSKRNPPYLSAKMFARVLIDTLVPDSAGSTNLSRIERTVTQLPEGLPAKKSLLALVRRADGELQEFERLVEQWYDEHMARVSGWYKRWSKAVLACVGLAIAIAANIDTLHVAHSLYADQPIRTAVLAQVSEGTLCQEVTDPAQRAACVQREITDLKASSLPMGWSQVDVDGWTGWLVKVVGWLLTALAVSFGAPFWFDALQRLASLRGTGPKPA